MSKVNYTKNTWTNTTRLSENLFNNIENGIDDCACAINEIPDWALTKNKPEYTPDELGVYSLALVRNQIAQHNINKNAHVGMFANALHNHTTSSIINFDSEVTNIVNRVRPEVDNSALEAKISALEAKIAELEAAIITLTNDCKLLHADLDFANVIIDSLTSNSSEEETN